MEFKVEEGGISLALIDKIYIEKICSNCGKFVSDLPMFNANQLENPRDG